MGSAGRRVLLRFFRHFSKNFLKCPSVVIIQPVFLSKISSARTFLWHLDFIIILIKKNSLLASCRTTAKEKSRRTADTSVRPFWTGGFWENQGRRFFLRIRAFHRLYGGHRRMPPCAWYSIDRSILTYQKKPCSRTGSAGLLLCTIQCSCYAFNTAIMPGWPFSVCWAFLLPPENLPASKNIFGNFQKSGQNRVFQVSY